MHEPARATVPKAMGTEGSNVSSHPVRETEAEVVDWSNSPLDDRIHAATWTRFGSDFSRVPVHADGPAPESVHAVGTPMWQEVTGTTASTRHPETTSGQPLDNATRARLENRYGADLSAVRVRLDGAATTKSGAAAFTIGNQIVVDPAYYRPGTFGGDVLLAHEVAHTVQQSESTGTGAGNTALEAEADRSALAAVGEHTETADGFLPRLRAALSLQSCRGCSPSELTLVERARSETDPIRLADLIAPATDDQLQRAEEAVADGGVLRNSVQAEALAWERALRAKDFRAIADLSRRSDARFRTAHGPRILEMLMSGGTTVKVDTTSDAKFVNFIRDGLQQLLGIESGFGLLVDLLATGQQVILKRGADQITQPADAAQAGRTITERGQLVRQPGQGTGSTVELNPDLLPNQATLGTDDNHRLVVIDLPGAPTLGHELIHALNNARGSSLRPAISPAVLALGGGVGLVRDPTTRTVQSPEEVLTSTGQTSFQQINPHNAPDTPVSFPGGPAISENDLRRQLSLPQRASHVGFPVAVRVARRGARSVDDLVARYRLKSGPLPAEAATVIREVMNEHGVALLLTQPGEQIPVPDPEYIRMRVRFVDGNATLADRLDGLIVP
jgi:hypothetical protein